MAQRVLLVRHAHAEWPHYQGRDFERPLTARGEADAAAAGRALREAGLVPEKLLASPALRTKQTALLIAGELGLPAGALAFVDQLYNAPGRTLEIELRRAAGTTSGLVMLVAHNPGISDLARRLSGDELAPPFAPADWRLIEPAAG